MVSYGMFEITPGQMVKDKEFFEKEIKPAVNFVKEFKRENNRLPSDTEFQNWLVCTNPSGRWIEYITQKSQVEHMEPMDDFDDVNWTDDFFAIAVWRGDWFEYYYSDRDEYKVNEWGWESAVVSTFFYTILGLIPMFFWWKYVRKAKSLST
jgi:hypothetical protein